MAAGELEPGSVFAERYRVERKLSEGGMGAVYEVTQLGTERRQALKLMHPELARDDDLRARFRREALVGARIDSDHVVQVHDAEVDEATRTPYLCMELLQGSDLEVFVQSHGAMSHDAVALVSRQLCHALSRAHAVGIIHRDLKPANLFLAQTRQADSRFVLKVLDFGIAKCVAEAATRGRTTGLLGSPLWLAPEQADPKQSVGPATDIWAYGLVVFYLLAGQSYWLSGAQEAAPIQMVLAEVLVSCMSPASERAVEFGGAEALPPGFDAWFARCTAREPAHRFATITEAHEALMPLLDAPAPTSAPRHREPELLAAPGSTLASAPASLSASAVTPPIALGIAPLPGAGGTFDPVATRVNAPGRGSRHLLLGAGVVMLGGLALLLALGRGAAIATTEHATLVTSSATLVVGPTSAEVDARAVPAEMVRIGDGTLSMGCDAGEPLCQPDQQPRHRVEVAMFFMDRHEVSVAAYRRCVEGGACAALDLTRSPGPDGRLVSSEFCNWDRAGREANPMNCVSWEQARDHCAWAGKRLPTEAEWEYAAVGSDGRAYPWGNEPPKTELCWRRGSLGTCVVDAPSNDVSPFGAVAMAGYVREWTGSFYSETFGGAVDATRRVFRGGCWVDRHGAMMRPATRGKSAPTLRGRQVGFRCARSADDDAAPTP